MTIFCPSSHLILSASRCEVCGWERPAPGEVGRPAWGPLELNAGLGGPGRSVSALPGIANGILVLPLRNSELVGFELPSGQLRWRQALPAGQMTRAFYVDGNRLLCSISDERSLEEAGPGMLAALSPQTGERVALWQPGTHQVSPPVLTDKLILMRTSSSELVALTRQEQPQLVWRMPLHAWWALPPVTAGELVLVTDGRAMHGEGVLVAYGLEDGTLHWENPTDGLLAHLPVVCKNVILLRNGRKALEGREISSGKQLWRRSYEHIYSNLQAGQERVYIVVRGKAPAGEAGHYLLQALDPLTGQPAWEAPLNTRVRHLQTLGQDTLLLGSDDGLLQACTSDNGSPLWEFALGSDEDPIQTELVLADRLLVAGTYFGKLVALYLQAMEQGTSDPQAALQRGDLPAAADAFALAGDFRQAAQIYAQGIKDTEKALALYEHAGLFAEAAELASSRGLQSQALKYYELTDNLLAQAETLLKMGDELEAAARFEQAGQPIKAAELYEQAGEKRKAFSLYLRQGNISGIKRLVGHVLMSSGDIEQLERLGLLEDAAALACKLGALDKAAKLYKQLDRAELELGVLEELARTRPEPWSLQRMAELARSRGRFQLEAQAWQSLGKPLEAAMAYHKAARQVEQVEPGNEPHIASLYELALKSYEEAGVDVECLNCKAKIVYYRSLPAVTIRGHTEKAFREGEFNKLFLDVHNEGRGIAHDLQIFIDTGRFEVDHKSSTLSIAHLHPDVPRTIMVFLRPLRDQVGEAVPLYLEWTWLDHQRRSYKDQTGTPVTVKSRSESPTGGTPAQIHYHGDVYQTEGGALQVISGDQVQAGGQKGDRVEIKRGEGVRLTPKEASVTGAAPTALCPNCHLPVENGVKFCDGCGYPLTAQKK